MRPPIGSEFRLYFERTLGVGCGVGVLLALPAVVLALLRRPHRRCRRRRHRRRRRRRRRLSLSEQQCPPSSQQIHFPLRFYSFFLFRV